MQKKWFAVRRGRQPGVYFAEWSDVRQQVDGFPSAEFKGFASQHLAEEFMRQGVGVSQQRAGSGRPSARPARRNASPKRTAAPPAARSPPSKRRPAPGTPGDGTRLQGAALSQADQTGAEGTHAIDPGLRYVVEFDGGSRGNPGIAGFGAVVRAGRGGSPVYVVAGFLPFPTTCNMAEYHGALAGIMAAQQLGVRSVHLVGDSQLVVRQLNGQYRVNAPQLQPLHQRLLSLLSGFHAPVPVEHVLRAKNRAADLLSNVGMDALSDVHRGKFGSGPPPTLDGPQPLPQGLVRQLYAQLRAQRWDARSRDPVVAGISAGAGADPPQAPTELQNLGPPPAPANAQQALVGRKRRGRPPKAQPAGPAGELSGQDDVSGSSSQDSVVKRRRGRPAKSRDAPAAVSDVVELDSSTDGGSDGVSDLADELLAQVARARCERAVVATASR